MKFVFNGLNVVFLSMLVLVMASCGGAEDRKVKYLEKGKGYLQENKLDKARIELKNALQIDPKFAEAYYHMGQLEEINRELAKALSYYEKALELDNTYVSPKIRKAKIFSLVGTREFLDKAESLIDEVLRVEPENTDARFVASTIKYNTGFKEIAIKELEDLINENKDLIEGIMLLSSVYIQDGLFDKAMDLLKKGVEQNSSNVSLKLALAKIYSGKNKLDDAEKLFLDVIKLDPDEFKYRVALSTFYMASNREEKAEETLRDAIKADEKDVRRYRLLVDFVAARRSVKEAEEILLESVESNEDVYELKFSLADFYKKIGDFTHAESVLQNIIDDKSFDVEGVKARVMLSEIYLGLGDFSGAKKLIDEVLGEHPANIGALLINSKIALKNSEVVTAINGLRTVLKERPKNTDVALLLANAHEQNGESELAENTLKNALSESPGNYKAHLNYIKYLSSKSRLSEVSRYLDQAILNFKDNFELLDLKLKLASQNKNEAEIKLTLNRMKNLTSVRGDVFLRAGQYLLAKGEFSEARKEFDQALAIMGDKSRPLELIVSSYILEKQPEKAVARLEKRLLENPDDLLSFLFLGKVYAVIKDFDKSRNNFMKAIENKESWAAPYIGLALVHIQTNNNGQAIEVYKKAIANVQNPNKAQLQLASLYERENQFDNAIQLYGELLEKNPANKIVANNLASLLIEHRTDIESIKRAQKLVSNFESVKHPAIRDTMGWVYVKSGDSEKGLKILQEVVELEPEVAVFQYHLGVALKETGDIEGAKKYIISAANSEQEFLGKEDAIKLSKEL